MQLVMNRPPSLAPPILASSMQMYGMSPNYAEGSTDPNGPIYVRQQQGGEYPPRREAHQPGSIGSGREVRQAWGGGGVVERDSILFSGNTVRFVGMDGVVGAGGGGGGQAPSGDYRMIPVEVL